MSLAERAIEEFGTRDVHEMARRAGVRIVFERWPLVSVGECETGLIRVNQTALERASEDAGWFSREGLERLIIAHELGHLLAAKWVEGEDHSEALVHGFVRELLDLPFAPTECERLWKR